MSKEHTNQQQLTARKKPVVVGVEHWLKLDTRGEKVKNRKHMAVWNTGQNTQIC